MSDDRAERMAELRRARLARVARAKDKATEVGTSGSFAILVRGPESAIDPRTNEPRAVWFSEFRLTESHLEIHRHSPGLQQQEWQSFLYADIWAAADRNLAAIIGIVNQVEADVLLSAMLENNRHVRAHMERGAMGVGIPHPQSRNRELGE
jgi:hypothetical protein